MTLSHNDVCLALIGANEHCARELARRIRGEVWLLAPAAVRSNTRLEQADAVAFLGPEVDWAILQHCLGERKHVLVAAEACREPAKVDALVEQARASATFLQFGNAIAYWPSRQLIWKQCQQGKLGEPGLIRIHRWGTKALDGASHENSLAAVLLLEIDNALRFFHEAPHECFAMEYPGNRGYALHLRWRSGAMAMIDCAWQLAVDNGYASFSVIGSQGSAYADDHENVQLLVQSQPGGWTVRDTSHAQLPMLMNFLDCAFSQNSALARAEARDEVVALNEDSPITWRRTLAIAKAIPESLSTRKAVELNRATDKSESAGTR